MKQQLTLVIAALLLSGCGMIGSQGVPKEQIDKDIASKTVKTDDGGDWIFAGDDQRCFAVMDDETKYTAANGEVVVSVASWRDISIGAQGLYRTVFGKMVLTYKKDGANWVLEKITPKELIEKTLEMDEFKKFVDIQTPLCKYSRFVK